MSLHPMIKPYELALIRESSALRSALYDLNLLPEQIKTNGEALAFKCAIIGYCVAKSETQTKETTE